MKNETIGIVDYGSGNCASVRMSLVKLGYRTRLVSKADDFKHINFLILPGVGAFSTAMASLHALDLVTLIRKWAFEGKPIIGICLGMQLLSEASYEHSLTRGLELIPGKVTQLDQPKWHIGWNSLESYGEKASFMKDAYGDSFYFNHSFEFKAPDQYVVSITRLQRPIVAIVRRDNIYGIQFHPEKSQLSGLNILKSVLKELNHA